MDHEVFVLSRIREEYDATCSTEQAVVNGLARTGRLVTSAAIILCISLAFITLTPTSTSASSPSASPPAPARRALPARDPGGSTT